MMYRKLLFILLIVLPIMAFMAISGAGAVCGDPPAIGVDWSAPCDMSGAILPGEVLAFANLTGTNLTSANLTGANMAFANATNANFTDAILDDAGFNTANLTGANFTNADAKRIDMRGAMVANAVFSGADLTLTDMSGAANFNDVSFAGATIGGLKLSNTTINRADFSGSEGSPALDGTDINDSTCPNGNPSGPSSPFCNWAPTAISLSGISAAAAANIWPLILSVLLMAGTTGVLIAKRKRGTQEVAVQ